MRAISLKKIKFRINWLAIIYSLLLSWLLVDLVISIDAVKLDKWIIDINRFTTKYILIFLISSILLYLIFHFTAKIKINDKIKSIFKAPILPIILFCQCFRDWYFSNFYDYVIYYDTSSYIENYTGDLLSGKVDVFRTPVYPYLIKLIKLFTGESVDIYPVIVFVQMALSLASVVILYFALKQVIINKYVVGAVCLIYGCAPAIILWDLCILTESLSLFSTVLLLFFVLRYLKAPSMKLAITIGLYSFYMLMLRPTFIYLFVILGVFFICRFIFSKFDRKQTIAGLLSIVFSCGLTFGYCYLNDRSNGYFGISSVGSDVNQLYIVIMNDMIDNPKYPEISQYINEKLDYYISTGYEGDYNIAEIIPGAAAEFGYNQVEDYVNSCIMLHRKTYNDYTINKFINEFNTPLGAQYSTMRREWSFAKYDNAFLFLLTPYTYISSFVTVLIALIYVFALLIKKQRIGWQALGLSAFIFTHLFVSIYGSMAEFSRLSIMAVPALMILTAYLFDLICSSVGNTESEIAINTTSQKIYFIKESNEKLQKTDEPDDVQQDNE